MVSTQAKYDMEYVFGEFGDNYNIPILNDDGTSADLTLYTSAKFTVKKKDGTLLFNAVTVTISSPNAVWAMTSAETTAQGYTGEAVGQVELLNTTTKKRLTKEFTVFIYKNQVD